MTCNTYDSPASKYSDATLTEEQVAAKLYTFDELIALEQNPVLKYDSDTLVKNISLTMTIFSALSPEIKGEYPFLLDRITQGGPITPPEYADFLDQSGFDPNDVNAALQGSYTALQGSSVDPSTGYIGDYSQTLNTYTGPYSGLLSTNYFSQLDNYYNKNMGATLSGGFCRAFTSALGIVTGLLTQGANLLSALKNGISGLVSQLGSIKQILTSLVDKLKTTLLEQINNIGKQLSNVIADIGAGIAAAGNFIANKIRQVQAFFSEDNIKGIKAKIEEIIAKMGAGYSKLTPEIIAYILFRLCQFTEVLQNFMKSPVDSLRGLLSNFVTQKAALTNFGNQAKLNAVQMGAYRRDDMEIARTKAQIADNVNSQAQAGLTPKFYTTKPPTQEEINEALALTESGNQYVTFASSVLNQNDPIKGAGWKKVQQPVWIAIFRVAKRMGKKFTINSGYRSPAYNASVGGAKSSMHMSGLAIDVSMSGVDRDKFIEIASQEGFQGIGTYATFIHVDLGSRRTWGGYNAQALALHRADSFRSNIPAVPTKAQ